MKHDQTLDTIGKILNADAKRDAVHFAVAPVVAAENLKPGQHVGKDGTTKNPIGVVDPFLRRSVYEGERFWLFLYPNTITSLRHEWAHPAFQDHISEKSESEIYLRAFADRLFSYYGTYSENGSRFELLLAQAANGFFGTDINYGPDCTPTDEFWNHFERYTGRKVVERHSYFRCAC